ncbi:MULTISPECIES: putative aminohydrolase SsnA [Paraclostridium]|uniref:putative aminohydrolase SsnA n=1 Tax=Paraclostridium TaxID=1849822 RepID=UPI00051DA881|nr:MULTISPECIES: putative aminohydrolase SsnA [Paraclostridium]KGJ48210.1 chlorohydrolase [Clostridium sp. NCR]MCU9810969.1 putative aminohydrolase SsnA [Paraclostridium sp. AKS81]
MILVGNGRLITKNEQNPYMDDGCVVIEGNVIKEIGSTKEMKEKYSSHEFIDANKKVIMPGLINTHMHIYSSFARGMAVPGKPSENFMEILENLWWRLDKKLTLEDTKYSAYSTYIECIKNGVTTVFDHHASPFAIEGSLFTIKDVAKNLGIRTNLCYEVSDRDGLKTIDQGIKENVDFIKFAQNDESDMVKGMFGLHAAFTLSDETLEKCANEMANLDAGYHVHTAEGIDDVIINKEKYNKKVVQRLNDFNVLNDKTIAVHCIHIDSEEMELIKENKSFVVHNPESNMGNAVGCAPVVHLLNKGITVGLGTDGYTSDMFESLKVANIIHKHQLRDPRVGWAEAPTMLFENNRKIASKHYKKDLGVLKEGAYADVIVVDYIPHTPLNENTENGHIIFGMTGRSVDTTIINGKVLMKDRILLNIDEESILAKSREMSNKLWDRI